MGRVRHAGRGAVQDPPLKRFEGSFAAGPSEPSHPLTGRPRHLPPRPEDGPRALRVGGPEHPSPDHVGAWEAPGGRTPGVCPGPRERRDPLPCGIPRGEEVSWVCAEGSRRDWGLGAAGRWSRAFLPGSASSLPWLHPRVPLASLPPPSQTPCTPAPCLPPPTPRLQHPHCSPRPTPTSLRWGAGCTAHAQPARA